MKILAPVNSAKEVEAIIDAGADEIYCGVLTDDWLKKYTNMASINRREWKSSNLGSLEELGRVIDIAHQKGKTVICTMNAFYSRDQFGTVLRQVRQIELMGIDAFIIADLGLILTLREEGLLCPLHISTGGTVFNSETVKFYHDLGIQRIIFPRHLRPDEIKTIIENSPEMEFEVFIMNRGCKNIDGYCTFHHGVNEVRFGKLWDIPKKLNLDQLILEAARRLPRRISLALLKANPFSSVGACFLNYDVSLVSTRETDLKKMERARKFIQSTFNLLTGIDTCGVCALYDFSKIGVSGCKIVGRNNLTAKKVRDVRFLKYAVDLLEGANLDKEEYVNRIKTKFKEIYGTPCREHCYYP